MKYLICGALALSVSTTATAESFFDSITADKHFEKEFNLRHRVESVRDDAFQDPALASTLRTRLGFSYERNLGMQFQFQADGVTDLGSSEYNTLSNGQNNMPVVSDPSFTEVNQAWVGYGSKYYSVKSGRQVLNVLNERFIGSDSFRQNEQSFDAVSASFSPTNTLVFDYGYINNVNRVIDPNDPESNIDSDVHYGVLKFSPYKALVLTPYAYFMNLRDERGNDTVGMQITGEFKLAGRDYSYLLDFAEQQEASDNQSPYSASYSHVQLGMSIDSGTFKFGIENLEANPDGEFQTPLASLHEFNGRADRFVSGAHGLGVKDIYVDVSRHFGEGVVISVAYHAYSSSASHLQEQLDYGDEWGWQLSQRIRSDAVLKFGYVKYRAEDGGNGLLANHVQRLWLGLSYQF